MRMYMSSHAWSHHMPAVKTSHTGDFSLTRLFFYGSRLRQVGSGRRVFVDVDVTRKGRGDLFYPVFGMIRMLGRYVALPYKTMTENPKLNVMVTIGLCGHPIPHAAALGTRL